MSTLPQIFITDQDYHRLQSLVASIDSEAADALEEELSRAHIIAQKDVTKDIVTMNSLVKFLDESTGHTQEMALVFPKDANLDAGRISILAPIGTALLGLKIGASIDWKVPNGTT